MFGSSNTILRESRRNLRVRDDKRLLWHVQDTDLVGYGKVCNISASGMLMELFLPHLIPSKSTFSFTPNLKTSGYIPDAGELVWQKKKRFSKNKYLCGIQFLDTSETTAAKLRKRVEEGVKKLIRARAFVNALDIVLVAVLVQAAVFAIWTGGTAYRNLESANEQMSLAARYQSALIGHYRGLYQQANIELTKTAGLYQQSQVMLQKANNELTIVRAALADSQQMLSAAQTENLQLQDDAAAVGALRKRDVHLTSQVSALKNQLDYYGGNVGSVAQGRSLIAFYESQIQDVRRKIGAIQREAKAARIAALHERDRIRSVLGNNGYLVKDGQIVKVDMQRFQNPGSQTPQGTGSSTAQKVKVDVTVFQ